MGSVSPFNVSWKSGGLLINEDCMEDEDGMFWEDGTGDEDEGGESVRPTRIIIIFIIE